MFSQTTRKTGRFRTFLRLYREIAEIQMSSASSCALTTCVPLLSQQHCAFASQLGLLQCRLCSFLNTGASCTGSTRGAQPQAIDDRVTPAQDFYGSRRSPVEQSSQQCLTTNRLSRLNICLLSRFMWFLVIGGRYFTDSILKSVRCCSVTHAAEGSPTAAT